jgi:hypothetical protein
MQHHGTNAPKLCIPRKRQLFQMAVNWVSGQSKTELIVENHEVIAPIHDWILFQNESLLRNAPNMQSREANHASPIAAPADDFLQ